MEKKFKIETKGLRTIKSIIDWKIIFSITISALIIVGGTIGFFENKQYGQAVIFDIIIPIIWFIIEFPDLILRSILQTMLDKLYCDQEQTNLQYYIYKTLKRIEENTNNKEITNTIYTKRDYDTGRPIE